LGIEHQPDLIKAARAWPSATINLSATFSGAIQPQTYSVVWHYVLLSVARPLEDLVKARSGHCCSFDFRIVEYRTVFLSCVITVFHPNIDHSNTFWRMANSCADKAACQLFTKPERKYPDPDASFRKMRKSLHGNFESSGKGKASQALRETSR
jgi:hypothetical protein